MLKYQVPKVRSSSEKSTVSSVIPLLWKSFISNPIFGGKYTNIHLYWMNKLAVYGLLGTIPFLIFIYNSIKNNLKYYDKEFTFYYLLSIFSIIALGFMKALVGIELWYVFFIVLPGFYYLPLLNSKRTQISFEEIHSKVQIG